MQCRCTFITCCSSTSPSTRIYAYKTSHVYDAIMRPMTAKKYPYTGAAAAAQPLSRNQTSVGLPLVLEYSNTWAVDYSSSFLLLNYSKLSISGYQCHFPPSSFVIFSVRWREKAVVRLSSVTFVHPTQATENFGNVSTPYTGAARMVRRTSAGVTSLHLVIVECDGLVDWLVPTSVETAMGPEAVAARTAFTMAVKKRWKSSAVCDSGSGGRPALRLT